MKHDSGDDEVPGYYSGGDVELDNAKLRIEVERLRGEVAEQRALLRWFLDGDDHTHEDDCGARGQHDRDVCRVAGCGDAECEGPHCTCDATETRDRARAALGEP